jgi:hypothetical protein
LAPNADAAPQDHPPRHLHERNPSMPHSAAAALCTPCLSAAESDAAWTAGRSGIDHGIKYASIHKNGNASSGIKPASTKLPASKD